MAAVGIGAGVRVGRLKPRLRISALALIALALAGCGSKNDDSGAPHPPAVDSTLTPAQRDSVLLLDEQRAGARRDSALAVEIRPLLEDWEEAWRRVIPGFQLESLSWQSPESLVVGNDLGVRAGHLVTTSALKSSALDSLTQRRWHLMFTPDRWLAVDPDFERLFFPDGRLAARGPAYVRVYDFRARRRLEVDHGDPRTHESLYEVTGWLGDRRLLVAGWRLWEGEASKIRPAVWIYDLDSLHRTTGMGPPVSEPELQAHEAMLELLIRMRNAPARRR